MNGLHILAEFHDCACSPDLLLDVQALKRTALTACDDARLMVVGQVFHAFGTRQRPAGATGAVVLAESHLALHTWPELQAVTLDIYVCNFSQDNRTAAESAYLALQSAFQPGRTVRRDVERGGPANSAACAKG